MKKISLSLAVIYITILLIIIIPSCKKDEPSLPILTTATITQITKTTGTSGGNIVNDGGGKILARGVCWSTNIMPSIYDNKTLDGIGTGSYISLITGLETNTTYYVRAYATNSRGTEYGTTMTFTTLDCMYCRQVTYQNDIVISQGSSTEYCGPDLIRIKATPIVTVLHTTYKIECVR